MRPEKKQAVQIKEGLIGHCKGFGFEYCGNLWKVFEKRNDTI